MIGREYGSADARAAETTEAPRRPPPRSRAPVTGPEDPDPPREGQPRLGTHPSLLVATRAPRRDDPGRAGPGRADQPSHPGPLREVPRPGGLRSGAGGCPRAGYQNEPPLPPEGENTPPDGTPAPGRGSSGGARRPGWASAAAPGRVPEGNEPT